MGSNTKKWSFFKIIFYFLGIKVATVHFKISHNNGHNELIKKIFDKQEQVLRNAHTHVHSLR